MFKSLKQKHKIILLHNSWKRGISQFLRQTTLIILDSVIRKKHLAFKLEAQKLPPLTEIDSTGCLTHGHSWEEFPNRIQEQIMCLDENTGWGDLSWLNQGWRLCVEEINQQVVCVGWIRSPQNSEDFFVEIPDKAELLWHLTVIPEYRGQKIHTKFWRKLMHERANEGIECFYTNCRDYNLPSYSNIRKLGFEFIGHRADSKLTGRRKWHPAKM